MKPQNVVEHKHFYAFDPDIEDLYGRYDACRTRDDGCGVWSPESGRWYPAPTWERAVSMAEHMAKIYAETHQVI
jgi:hypothetical protein